MKIGIGITTTSKREKTAQITIGKILEFRPDNSEIYIVSDVDGIAKAKNDCLRGLDGCEHIFLFDDDCYPIVKDWHLPYVNSGIKHMSFTFSKLHHGGKNGNRELLKQENGLCYYKNPCGCMMYIHRDCIDTIGGFDESYAGYSYEHVIYSIRAYNAGVIPEKFIDVENSLDLFHSMDYFCEVKSSVEHAERYRSIQINRQKYNQDQESKQYIPYK